MVYFWLGLAALAVVAVALYRRHQPAALGSLPTFADEREERLARTVARTVGASAAAVLPAVRREIELSPLQSDETLAKRAAYHYRQELPERACSVYRDSAPG